MYFLTVLEAGNLRLGYWHGWAFCLAILLLCPLSSGQEERHSLVPSYKSFNVIRWEPHDHDIINLYYLPKALFSNTITLRIRTSTFEFWKDTNIQPIILVFPLSPTCLFKPFPNVCIRLSVFSLLNWSIIYILYIKVIHQTYLSQIFSPSQDVPTHFLIIIWRAGVLNLITNV